MKPERNGFTLIELLVSLAILGFVSAMLVSGTSLTRRMADRAAIRSDGNETIVTAQTVLRNRIETIVPRARTDLEQPIVDIRGGRTVLSFFAPPPPVERPTTALRYRLLKTPAGQLALYTSPDLSAMVNPYAPGESGWTPTILLTNVDTIDIDYFGAAPPDGIRRWRTQWTEQFQPPELIRIKLAFMHGDTRQWPDLIARPAATVNASCRLGEASGKCGGT